MEPIITRTETHEFTIRPSWYGGGAFDAEFRPINPRNGKPWQRSHRIEDYADVTPKTGWDRPVAYSTVELAQKGVEFRRAVLEKRNKGR